MNIIKIYLLFLILLTSACQTHEKLVENAAAKEYHLNNGVPQENIKFSPLRYTGERGKVFMTIEILPTRIIARPGFNEYQLYNQTLRGIIQTECAKHFSVIKVALGFVEYLEVKTQKYSDFSHRTYGRAVCHGFLKKLDYKL